ncbi:MAG: CBS domain-containing protein [Rectinemataceae bacterium]
MSSVPIDTESGPQVVLELLYRLRVRDAMTRGVATAAPGDTLRSVQYLMRDRNITGVPVLDGNRLVGIVSIGDIIAAFDEGRIGESAEGSMNATVISLEEDMPLSFAVTYFDRYKYGRFPVLDRDGRLVGIITASDIVRNLLVALNAEVAKLERTLSADPDLAPRTGDSRDRGASGSLEIQGNAASGGRTAAVELRFAVTPLDFSRSGEASSKFKRALAASGFEPAFVRRVAVASYELEMNQVIHSAGGIMAMRISPDHVEISADDEGPGIADLDAAMREGFSTATEWVRSLGFGAGMGLPNVKRVSDEFAIESEVGKGTKVRALLRRGGA